MPAAPVRLCHPVPVWDGRDLVVVEPGSPPCRPAAAAYNPRTNSWAVIAGPPKLSGSARIAAWGGGRLVLVSPVTGVTVTWSPATGQWRQIGTLPSKGAVSATWTGGRFLVITLGMTSASKGTARAYALSGDRWTRLPDLPQPRQGRTDEVATAADDGAVYALAHTEAINRNGNYTSWSTELLRLTATAWTPAHFSSVGPGSGFVLTSAGGALLAAGAECVVTYGCAADFYAAALLGPGARPATIALRPRPGVPSPSSIAAGGRAIVLTYPEGIGGPIPASKEPAPGSSQIYDITTGRWLRGPAAPFSAVNFRRYWGAYWTSYGVISLGQFTGPGIDSAHSGGWLLRPSHLSD